MGRDCSSECIYGGGEVADKGDGVVDRNRQWRIRGGRPGRHRTSRQSVGDRAESVCG